MAPVAFHFADFVARVGPSQHSFHTCPSRFQIFLKLNFRLSREGLSLCPYERCLDQVVDDAAGGVALIMVVINGSSWRLRSRAEVRPRAHVLLVRPLAGHVFLHGLLIGRARPEPFCARGFSAGVCTKEAQTPETPNKPRAKCPARNPQIGPELSKIFQPPRGPRDKDRHFTV